MCFGMNCEKCGEASRVRFCDVDGFAYYLCVTCADEWDAVSSHPEADAETRSVVQ